MANTDGRTPDMGFLKLFEDGKRFMEELLKENQRLRLLATKLRRDVLERESSDVELPALRERLRHTEEEMGNMRTQIEALRAQSEELRGQNEELRGQFASIEDENHGFAERYVEVERQNSDLISMYVASYRLHSTLEYAEVVGIVKEIIINLIGAERFGIYLADEHDGRLCLISHEGLEGQEGESLTIADDGALAALRRGEAWRAALDASCRGSDRSLALIPLRARDKTVGVIDIRQLMTQKVGFAELDNELFELLAKHAATAIYSASLYTRSERKRQTLESFLDLLRPREALATGAAAGERVRPSA